MFAETFTIEIGIFRLIFLLLARTNTMISKFMKLHKRNIGLLLQFPLHVLLDPNIKLKFSCYGNDFF